MFSSNAISEYYTEILQSNKSTFEFNIGGQYYVIFQINTNPCQIGEIYRPEINRYLFFFYLKKNVLYYYYNVNGFSCQKCESGTYSLKTSDKTNSCLSCTSEFVCPGGSSILLNEGNN